MFISKSLRIILISIVISSLFALCIFGTVYMEWTYGFFGYEWDGFKNKEQVINAVKDNINDLKLLTNEILLTLKTFSGYKYSNEKQKIIDREVFSKS